MSLHDRIKEARKYKGLTQEQLGKLIGVAKTTIAGYEKNREPTAAKLGEMSEILGVDVNFLLQDEMKKPLILIDSRTRDLPKPELTLLHNFRQLNEDGQDRLLENSDDMVASGKYQRKNPDTPTGPEEETVRVFRAAHSADNHDSEILDIPKSVIEKLRAAKPVDEI